MLLLDITIVNVALPNIASSLGASLSDLQWVIDAYALTLASLLLTAGSVADLYGRRLVFAVGTGVFVIGSLLCGLATGPLFLVLARSGQGIGGAAMFATALALLGNAFRNKDRGTAFGVFGAVTGVAIAVGPVLGGLITTALSWRWIFYLNLPVGVAAIVIALLRVDESRAPQARRPDWLGFATFSSALAALVYGLIRSSSYGWTDDRVIVCLGLAALLLVLFIAAERLQKNPMFDLELCRNPSFVGGLVAAFALSGALYAMVTYLVLYLQNILGFSAIQTGLRFLVLTGATFVVAGGVGRLTSVVPVRLLIAPGFVLVGTGLLLMRGLDETSPWTHLVPGFILAGIGAGMINPPLASTAVGVVPPEQAGMASGVNTTFRQVGIATGIAVLGSVFAARLRDSATATLASSPQHVSATDVARALGGGHSSPNGLPGIVRQAVWIGFADGLNLILLLAGLLAFLAAVLTFALIRQRDFVDLHESVIVQPTPRTPLLAALARPVPSNTNGHQSNRAAATIAAVAAARRQAGAVGAAVAAVQSGRAAPGRSQPRRRARLDAHLLRPRGTDQPLTVTTEPTSPETGGSTTSGSRRGRLRRKLPWQP
jgi:EmrB/QacA subfamily drug resistance transporter